MKISVAGVGLAVVLALGSAAAGQAPQAAAGAQADAALTAASSYVGLALFLRCFCADGNLAFDAEGKLTSASKTTDWTLAGFNLQKVERKSPGVLELQGVRVAIKYAADRHEFERHPQNDEKIRITLPESGDAKRMEQTLAAMFAIGIDLPLQRSMPEYWRHYFDPRLAWPQDELTGLTIPAMSAAATGGPMVPPSVQHRTEAPYTTQAQHDRVRGAVVLRLVVTAKGEARHVQVVQPLGYGLEQKAVETMSKFRFNPATNNGVVMPASVLLQEDYAPAPVPPR